jgi:hypothetical protein
VEAPLVWAITQAVALPEWAITLAAALLGWATTLAGVVRLEWEEPRVAALLECETLSSTIVVGILCPFLFLASRSPSSSVPLACL